MSTVTIEFFAGSTIGEAQRVLSRIDGMILEEGDTSRITCLAANHYVIKVTCEAKRAPSLTLELYDDGFLD